MSIYLIPTAKPHVTVEDWFRNFHHCKKLYEQVIEKSFIDKNEGNKLRDLSSIETQWNLNYTNELLSQRIKEITEWKDIILHCIQSIKREMERLTHEKEICTKDKENLYSRYTTINECNTLRNSKKRGDICQDNVTVQLNQEYQLLENVKTDLANKCEDACHQIVKLNTLLNTLQNELELKNEACEIEKETLQLNDIPSSISHKPDINNMNYISYNSWLENCKLLVSETEKELEISNKLRKEMCIPRENGKNLLIAQYEITNYAFRKRIYETRFILDELQWEKENLINEKKRLSVEMNKLEETKYAENEALKLVESQNRNRICRANTELCQDECTDNFEIQVLNLRNIIRKLNSQLELISKTSHKVEERIEANEKEARKKTWALSLDIRCLELRNEPTI